MTSFSRFVCLSVATSCLILALGTEPALATPHHHKHHRHSGTVATSNTVIRIAQAHLSNLGYYHGKIDGLMGPQTRAAIKKFQHENALKADGLLGPKTNRALGEVDHQKIIGTTSFVTHDVVTGNDQPIAPDYAPNLGGGNKQIMSRFSKIDVAETGSGPDKRYNVNINGQPILSVNGQPTVIGISPTYDLGQEDAVVFSTFNPVNTGCAYKNHVLILSSSGSKLLDIENCTREFQARVDNNSLFIVFPERDDNRAVGATYRVEGDRIEKL